MREGERLIALEVAFDEAFRTAIVTDDALAEQLGEIEASHSALR